MIAVNVKNTPFDEAVVKQVLVYNCKKTFRCVAKLESSSLHGYKGSKYSSRTRYKLLLGFFSRQFEKCYQNLRIFGIPTNLHIVRVTKH